MPTFEHFRLIVCVGGKVEPGETPLEAAARELEVIPFIFVVCLNQHWLISYFQNEGGIGNNISLEAYRCLVLPQR